MGKPWNRNKKKRDKAHHGPCFVEGCKHNGSLMHHCKLCEELQANTTREFASDRERKKWEGKKPFTVQFCGHHVVEANKAIKRHVLLKHPVTIPGLLLAKLVGDE